MRYDERDLMELDDRCYELACGLGLEPPATQFHLVRAEEMYDIASRGLPGRYSHYQFGKLYEQQKREYDTGRSRIYELVVNTRPVHAYLMDGNSLVAQLLVIAHVYGHGVMYQHNAYFKPADKNILSRVHSAADRVDKYITDFGRGEVEDFIDACEALQWNAYLDQLGKRSTVKEPKFETKDYDDLFPAETDARRDEFRKDKETYRHSFPKQPERDILRFVEQYSPRMQDWQKDIISIIRTEREYFAPQMRSKVLHEGVASYYHQQIVQQIMLESPLFFANSDAFMEFQSMNARVLHPKIQMKQDEDIDPDSDDDGVRVHCTGYNPYLLGYTLLQEIERIAVKPTKEEREQWAWAGEIDPQDKRNEIIRLYDDISLLPEFINQNVCEKAKIFMRPRTRKEYKKLHVSEKEMKMCRTILAKDAMTRGMPIVEVVNGDGRARGELWLEHRYDPDDKVGLDEEYALGTVSHLAKLWGRGVVVHSIQGGTDTQLTLDDPEEDVEEPSDVWYYASPTQDAKAFSSMSF